MSAELHIETSNTKVKIVLPNPSTVEKQQLIRTMQQVMKLHPDQIKRIKYESLKDSYSEKEQEVTERIEPQEESDKRYQAYYICPKCGYKEKRFISEGQSHIYCLSCGFSMSVRPATSAGFPNQDRFGNYFIAGAFESKE